MLTKEDKRQLIDKVIQELDTCSIYFNEPEKIVFPSSVDDDSMYWDCFSWNYAAGASKLVLFPPNEDYVVKIPFNGFKMAFDEYEDLYYREHPVPEEEWDTFDYERNRIIVEATYYEEDTFKLFSPFCGASLESDGWDYCALEEKIGELAKKYGLGDIFVPTEYLFSYHGYPIYIQQKCEVESTFTHPLQESYSYSDESRETSRAIFDSGFGYLQDTSWLAAAFEKYGEEKILTLSEFIEEYHLGDLRNENRGLLNGKPVLIDYCDFCE